MSNNFIVYTTYTPHRYYTDKFIARMALHPMCCHPITDLRRQYWPFRVVYYLEDGLSSCWRYSCLGADTRKAHRSNIYGHKCGYFGSAEEALRWLEEGEND